MLVKKTTRTLLYSHCIILNMDLNRRNELAE